MDDSIEQRYYYYTFFCSVIVFFSKCINIDIISVQTLTSMKRLHYCCVLILTVSRITISNCLKVFYLHGKFCFGPKKRQPKFQLIDLLEAFLLVSNIINSNVHVIHPYKLAFYVQQLKTKWNFAFCCTVFGIKVICTIFCFVLFLANPFRITEKSTENEN